MKRIMSNLCDRVGNTPVIPLPSLSATIDADIFGKAEFLNPGGSIKDRVALSMIRAAEAEGLAPGSTLVEATAGNTGLGLAWICATLGYSFIAVMSEADKGPKTDVMQALGSEVVLAPHDTPWNTDEGALGIAARLAEERGGVFLNQFSNPANPHVHETVTAVEVLDAFGDDLDAVVVGVGTGGTATGLGRGLKARRPDLRLIGVVAEGAYLASEAHDDRIAGITPDFAPEIFDPSLVDHIEAVTSEAAFATTKQLIRAEGLPVGHSAGACVLAAEREARRAPGSRILIFLCDGLRNYPELLRD